MGELARMLDTYRRLGFEKLSEQERQVLTELLLGAVVEMQEGVREIKEGIKALSGLTDEVTALKRWQEAVEEGVGVMLRDQRSHYEGSQRAKWGLIEKAGAFIAMLIGLGILYLIAREASSAEQPSPSRVEVDGTVPGAEQRVPQDFEEEQRSRPAEERVRTRPATGWINAYGLGRYVAALHSEDEFRLAPQDLRRLTVQAPLSGPTLGLIHEPQAFFGITERRGPSHPAERAGGRAVRHQGAVGEDAGIRLHGAEGVTEVPSGLRLSGDHVRGGGVGTGEVAGLVEPILNGVQRGHGLRVVLSEPPGGEGFRLGVPLGFDEVAYVDHRLSQGRVGRSRRLFETTSEGHQSHQA